MSSHVSASIHFYDSTFRSSNWSGSGSSGANVYNDDGSHIAGTWNTLATLAGVIFGGLVYQALENGSVEQDTSILFDAMTAEVKRLFDERAQLVIAKLASSVDGATTAALDQLGDEPPSDIDPDYENALADADSHGNGVVHLHPGY